MKKLFLLLPILIVVFMVFTGQKSQDTDVNNIRWNKDPRLTRMYPVGDYVQLPFDNSNNVNMKFSTEPRTVQGETDAYVISPNFMVHPSFNTQSETPISRHPTNANIMFAAANTFGGGSSFTTGTYVTTDGGVTWFGSDTISIGTFNSGDPAPIIDKDGRFIISYITLTGAMGVSYSTNNGINFTPTYTLPGSTVISDKEFACTDDVPTSPFYGRSYIAYTEFQGAYYQRIVGSYSTDGGVTWSVVSPISPPYAGQHFHQGVDIKVAPNGDVVAVWANSLSSNPSTEDSLGFARSTNGGVSWAIAQNNADNMNGIRTEQLAPFGIRAAGFPRLDIDKTSGARRGWIYAVTNEKFVAPATDQADVILHRSTDGGLTWTATRVNQDTPGNGALQYCAAVNVDEQGGLNVIYYDTRNSTGNDSAQIYVSRSLNGGNSWEDIRISDHKFKPKSINGTAYGYQGDYIGITSGNGKLWPYWCEDISGLYQAWTASVSINLDPLNPYNLTSPAPNTTITTYNNSLNTITFNWDTSTSTSSYKWIFGNPTSATRKITMSVFQNLQTFTSAQLDTILAGLGVAVGDSLVGQWDVWAYRNNVTNDSLKATNGPRAVTLKRGIPPLTAFNLTSPVSGTSITTSSFDFSNVNFIWKTSGPGVRYKWKFGSPSVSNSVSLSYTSNISGIDSSFTILNNDLDAALSSIGVGSGDTISGDWSVWAYNGIDSVKASQNFALELIRQKQGEFLVLYDSTLANCRISKDSVINNLSALGYTYQLFNRKGNTSTDAITFKGFEYVFLIGEASSVMSNAIKDSMKAYFNYGTVNTPSKVIIMSEDIGYHLDRANSVYYDSAFARSTLGFAYVADRPGVFGARGLTGVDINMGLSDSTTGPSPDVLKKSGTIPAPESHVLYKYRVFVDSMNAIGRQSPTFNVSVMAVDPESIRPGAPDYYPFAVKRIIDGLIHFVDRIPTNTNPGQVNNSIIPDVFSLSQNYPNPFNPSTKITYQLPVNSDVSIKVFDMLGKEIMTLVNEKKDAGSYEVQFNAANFASGMYFYRISAGNFTDTKRMILIK